VALYERGLQRGVTRAFVTRRHEAPSDCHAPLLVGDSPAHEPENHMVHESSNTEAGRANTPRSPGENSPNLRDSLHQAAGVAAESATELGREARAKADKVRTSAARGLDTAADAMHAGGDRVASAAHRAGDALASGAEYARANDAGDMADDFMDLMRNNPGPTLLCAAALGFLLGRAVYRH
jgi:ElaB/YqjD/DUF883 family membrane-anchored ribosome-binding protein